MSRRRKRAGKPPGVPAPSRYQAVDALRGFAIVLMVAYHFCYDLDFFHVIDIDPYHGAFWVASHIVILTLFLLVVGISLHIATRNGVRWRRHGRRVAQIAIYAGLVSVASYIVFPRSWIFFGVLHFIAVAAAVGVVFTRFFWVNLLAGLGILALAALSHPVFDTPWLQWAGMTTRLPTTEDYVPFVPWFGVVLLGLFLGKVLFPHKRETPFGQWRSERRPVHLLALAGRHSLNIYVLHQPLLLGMLYVAVTLSGR